MNKLLFVATYAAVVAVAFAWQHGPLAALVLAPFASSLSTLVVAAVASLGRDGISTQADIDGLMADRV